MTTSRLTPPPTPLKRELFNRGIRHQDFAKSVGLHPTVFSRIVNGHRPQNAEVEERIARELDVTTEQLWPTPKEAA